jgi:hypothetical protein
LHSIPPVEGFGLPNLGKVRKRRKALVKARKLVLRKRVLSMILGKDLANTVHPLLNAAGGVAAPVDVPVAIPSLSV